MKAAIKEVSLSGTQCVHTTVPTVLHVPTVTSSTYPLEFSLDYGENGDAERHALLKRSSRLASGPDYQTDTDTRESAQAGSHETEMEGLELHMMSNTPL